MESKGIEWECPNCKKKKHDESKAKSTSRKQRNSTSEGKFNDQSRALASTSVVTSPITPSNSKVSSNSNPGKNPLSSSATQCVVCKKEARKASAYCSDACILAHAEVASPKEKPSLLQAVQAVKTVKLDPLKLKSEGRIIVQNKSNGKILTGMKNLKKKLFV